MENDNKIKFRTERHDRFWTGLVLLVVGGFWLAERLGADFPSWLFDWPTILILIGVVTGFKHRFENLSWLIMVGVGTVFLIDKIDGTVHIREYLWPALIMFLGLVFILRPKKKWRRDRPWDNWNNDKKTVDFDGGFKDNVKDEFRSTANAGYSSDDEIDSVSVFGGVKKIITSKTFRGGEIICFMGGAEYNLSQADISGPVSIEVIQVFGGTKLIVPPHWEVRSESLAIFAGFEDKRPAQPGAFDPSKILIIKGTSVFGGIEIRSY